MTNTRTPRSGLRARAATLGLLAGLAAVACAKRSPASPAAHDATGVIRSFGEGRKTVRISHDDIPGYMNAMTMTFDAKGPEQLEGLGEKDGVRFSFTEEGDGRYLLQSIEKR